MSPPLSDLLEEAQLAARSLLDYGDGLINPTVRLGVTGLSRAGKTVFITALVHGLLRGGRFPVFEALAGGRIASARLEPQPDDTVAALRLRKSPARADRGAALAVVHRRHQRAAPRHRLSAPQRRLALADPRHRRLSRRVAARPAAAGQELRAVVGGKPGAVARRAAAAACRRMARASGDALAGREGGRTGGAHRGKAVHGLPESLPRRALRHEPAAARPLPAARQRRRLAGADLRAARRAAGRRGRRPVRSGR